MHWPHMTTRRWMLAVGIAAALLGLWIHLERRTIMLKETADLRLLLAEITEAKLDLETRISEGDRKPLSPERARNLQNLHDYYIAMSHKYRRAAQRPWLPVAPDPPLPK